MASQLHLGHVFHLAGSPTVTEAAAALVSIADGALVIDENGHIVFCGERTQLPTGHSSATVHDHRPGFLLPGFVDTHIHFPQTYAGDSYGGGQLLEWLNLCIFPSESLFADPEFAQQAAVEFCNRRVAVGTTAAIVFGSAFPHAQDALFTETARRGLRIVSGRGIQTVGGDTAKPLLTTEEDAIRLTREEIEKWHAAEGDAFKVHITESGDAGVSMHPAEMLFIGTLGGARALDMENRFGNFDIGKEADFVVVDPSRTPALHGPMSHAVRSADAALARDQTLFLLLMGMRDTSIAEVYVKGRRVQ
jgi:guanine deaminase